MSKEKEIAIDFIVEFEEKLRAFGRSNWELRDVAIFSNDAKLYHQNRCGFYGIVGLDGDCIVAVEASWENSKDMCRTEDIIGYTKVLIKTMLDAIEKEENGR